MAQLLVFGTYQTYHKSSGGRMDFSSLPRSWQVAVVRWCRNPSNHTDKGRATIGNSVDGSREKFGPNPSKSLEEKSIPKKIQQGLLYCCTKWIQNEPKKKMAKRPDWYCRCCQCSPGFCRDYHPTSMLRWDHTLVTTTDALISNHIQSHLILYSKIFHDLSRKALTKVWF